MVRRINRQAKQAIRQGIKEQIKQLQVDIKALTRTGNRDAATLDELDRMHVELESLRRMRGRRTATRNAKSQIRSAFQHQTQSRYNADRSLSAHRRKSKVIEVGSGMQPGSLVHHRKDQYRTMIVLDVKGSMLVVLEDGLEREYEVFDLRPMADF